MGIMVEVFDPYYQWLGVRDPRRPPDHYRLLGVARFEDDPEVVQNAADRQMAHVRTFQTGRHSAESQQLLNELAAAKLCLLNAQKKAAYDALLRTEPADAGSTAGRALPLTRGIIRSRRVKAILDRSVDAYLVRWFRFAARRPDLCLGPRALNAGSGQGRVDARAAGRVAALRRAADIEVGGGGKTPNGSCRQTECPETANPETGHPATGETTRAAWPDTAGGGTRETPSGCA